MFKSVQKAGAQCEGSRHGAEVHAGFSWPVSSITRTSAVCLYQIRMYSAEAVGQLPGTTG